MCVHVCLCQGWVAVKQPLIVSLPTQERYYVLYIQPSRIHRRRFDPKGKETEPNFSASRKVNTGFLMSSYSRYPWPPSLPQRCCLLGFLAPKSDFWA